MAALHAYHSFTPAARRDLARRWQKVTEKGVDDSQLDESDNDKPEADPLDNPVDALDRPDLERRSHEAIGRVGITVLRMLVGVLESPACSSELDLAKSEEVAAESDDVDGQDPDGPGAGADSTTNSESS